MMGEYMDFFEKNILSLKKRYSYIVEKLDEKKDIDECGVEYNNGTAVLYKICLLYTSPSPRDRG